MRISVVMPTFNRPEFLREAVLAVINQTHTDWELVIKEGGEGRGLEQIKDLLMDPRIIYIYSQDEGITDAINTALMVTTGEILNWANDDDRLVSTAFETVLNEMKGHQWLYGLIQTTDKNGNNLSISGHAGNLEQLKQGNFIPQPSVFWTRLALDEVGYFSDKYDLVSDYEYWIRLMKKYPPKFVNSILSKYTIHDGQLTNTKSQKQLEQARRVANES